MNMLDDFKIGGTFLGVPTEDLLIHINMIHAAKNNSSLQELLERAKILYYLSKKDGA